MVRAGFGPSDRIRERRAAPATYVQRGTGMQEAFGIALKLMGRSINEKDPAVLRNAAEMLKQQKRLVRTYNSSDFAHPFAVAVDAIPVVLRA